MQRIVLRVPASFRFRAGQYLEILHPAGSIPLSIASAPWRLPDLHLHYRSTPGVADAERMDELLGRDKLLSLRGPAGDVALPGQPRAPVLLVAGGTGMAQASSLLEELTARRASGDPGPATVTLLWCADAEADFYLRRELTALSDWLETVLIADADRSPANRALAWLREHGARAAGAGGTVVIAGSPAFVYAANDLLVRAGVDAARIQSDVFSYLPRTRQPPS